MANSKPDQNSRGTLIALSSANDGSIVQLWADPTTHALLTTSASGSGITSINADSTVAQLLVVGTAGTNFAIVDNGTGTHTFNLPVASATNTGKLSSTDWSTFNNKGSGTVTSVSVVSANGFAGTVATATTTPAITLTTSINSPVLAGNGTAIAAATTTGSGSTVVLATSPTITTASLGSSTATTQAPSDNSTKLATTAYVDNAVLGQNFKEAVKYASIAALPSIIYANGSSGVGATLTGVALGAISLDSSSPAVADRVLIKNQVSTFQNGIYTVTATGSGAAVFVLTRAIDSDQSSDWKTGDSVFVTSGNTLSTTTWAYTGVDSPVMGTDAITWAQTAGQGSFTAGNGIAITGVSIAIDTAVTVDKTTAQTLTNKTLTSPNINEAVALTSTSTKLNLITNAGGTTGTTSTNIVFSTSPTLVTPTLGVASATTINKVTLTTPATGSTLTILDGKTAKFDNTLEFAGTDSTVMTFPTTTATIARTDAAQTFTGTQTFSQVITTANAITASGNAATVPVTSRHNIVTNNSAATLTVTLTTTSAVNMQTVVVQILDFSAVAQTITWVNTENSTVTAPTTSNGSTSLPLTIGFIYNSGTSKWRCIASA